MKKNPGIDASNFDSPFQSPAIRANLKAIAKSYGRYALKFGCSKFVWGTMTPDMSQFTLKYLPPDATMADWKKMTIVTVDALMGKPSKDQQMITNTIGKFEGQFKRADIITDKNYLDPQQEPMMFIQYNMSASFHVAAAYLRTGTTSASLIQLEERVDAMPDEDALEVHRLVFPQAGQPEPAKKK